MPRHPRLLIPGATYDVRCRVARSQFGSEALRKEGVDQEFKSQVDGLDAAFSRRG